MTRPLDGPAPQLKAPPGTVDCHIHFYHRDYPGMPGGPPPPEDATIDDYAVVQRRLGLHRMVIVQPNAYQFNNDCLLDALRRIGPKARAIAAVRPGTTPAELQRLHAAGVRGARIMALPGGAAGMAELPAIAAMVRPLDWHVIVQFDGREMPIHLPVLEAIEGPYVIDHIGKFLEPVPPDDPRVDALLRLMDRGNCYVKIAACYETSKSGGPAYEDVGRIARRLIAHAPERILWASNWPHVGVPRDAYPDDAELLDVLLDWAPSETVQRQILVDTPTGLYGF